MRMNIHHVTHIAVEEIKSYGTGSKGSGLHIFRKDDKPIVVDLFFDDMEHVDLFATAVAEAGIKVDDEILHSPVNLGFHQVERVRFDHVNNGISVNIRTDAGSHTLHLYLTSLDD